MRNKLKRDSLPDVILQKSLIFADLDDLINWLVDDHASHFGGECGAYHLLDGEEELVTELDSQLLLCNHLPSFPDLDLEHEPVLEHWKALSLWHVEDHGCDSACVLRACKVHDKWVELVTQVLTASESTLDLLNIVKAEL